MTRSRSMIFAGAIAGFIAVAAACSEPAPPPPPPAPTPATAEARVKLFTSCWDQFNNKAWDQFQNCFAENATAENIDSGRPPTTGRAALLAQAKAEAESSPDRRGELKLALFNGSRIAAVAAFTGTNTGPMPGPDGKPMPATNKKFGLLIGQYLELDAMGAHATRESVYIEEGTFASQLGLSPQPYGRPVIALTGAAPITVIAKNDATETANVATVRAMMEAGNKHDFKAMETFMADNYKLIDVGQPQDLDKKAAMAASKEFLGAFKDLQATASDVWAAGDYVVIVGRIDGTNTGPMPSMGIAKATNKKISGRFLEICKIENGKVTEDWLFYNTAAVASQLGLK